MNSAPPPRGAPHSPSLSTLRNHSGPACLFELTSFDAPQPLSSPSPATVTTVPPSSDPSAGLIARARACGVKCTAAATVLSTLPHHLHLARAGPGRRRAAAPARRGA